MILVRREVLELERAVVVGSVVTQRIRGHAHVLG